MSEAQLRRLAAEWQAAKERELQAREDRLAIEARAYTLIEDRLEPRKANYVGPFKVTTRETDVWDQEKLAAARSRFTDEEWPFELVYKPINRAINDMAVRQPTKFSFIKDALTTKSAKPGFAVVEEVE